MELQIEHITDEAGAAAYHELDVQTVPVDHPGLLAEPVDDVVGMLSNPMAAFHAAFYLGRAGGDVVASGFLGLPMIDNTHTCNVYVTVSLEERRRGYGSQMLQFLLGEGRAADRRVAMSFVGAPLGGTAPGNLLAASLGATDALGSIRRELRLADLDRAALETMLKELGEGLGAPYDLVWWSATCPDEYVDGAAKILPRVMSDSPRGDLDLEDEVWDAARYRDYEGMLIARRRHVLVTAAIERASGRLVAYTDLNVAESEHRVVTQQGTAVEPDHRGRRLGLAVKAANLLRVLDAYPEAETVQTYNAKDNEHMIAVNEALGFRAVERETIWQLAI